MNTLVAFSGGADSTFLLYKLLTETDDQVRAFLIDFSEVRFDDFTASFYRDLAKIEIPGCQNIIDWLSANIRPVSFQVVTSGNALPADYPEQFQVPPFRGWRVPPMLTAAAKLQPFDRFVYGKTLENRRVGDWAEREAYHQQYWARIAPGTTFEMPLITARHGRAHALKVLPAELQALMLSCDTPLLVNNKFKACASCSKCVMNAHARTMLEGGATPEAINENQMVMRQAGPHIGNPAGIKRFGAVS